MRADVRQTAENACLCRAAERHRPAATRIVDDPFAELFLGAGTRAALATFRAHGWLGRRVERRVPGLAPWLVARHRQVDEWLARALDDPSVEQVVVLAAGFDTRAWRFAKELRGRPLFELDAPELQERKARIAASHARKLPDVDLRRVPIDLAEERIDAKLLAAGFRPGARSFFLWEGVAMFRGREEVKRTLLPLRALAGLGSELAMDWWHLLDDPVARAESSGTAPLELMGEPLRLCMHPEDVGDFLLREGHELHELADAATLAERYVRDARRIHPAAYLTLSQTR